MTPERLAQIEQMREIHRAERNRWQVALDTITDREPPGTPITYRRFEHSLGDDRGRFYLWLGSTVTLLMPRAAWELLYEDFVMVEDDRDEHDNSAPADVQ